MFCIKIANISLFACTLIVCVESMKVTVVEYYLEDYDRNYWEHWDYILKNSQHFVHLISESGQEGSQLIVFPPDSFAYIDEFSTPKNVLRKYAFKVPDVDMDINLCTLPEPNRYKKALREISCTAQEYNIFVVMNLLESIEDYIYSSYIVFDNNGKIIAKCVKDLYTGKRLHSENCNFTAHNYDFALITENELFSPDLAKLIGNAKTAIYATHKALNYTVFPSVPIYEMIRRKNKLTNLLVSAKHDSARGVTGSGILTPWDSKVVQMNTISKSIRLSEHLGFVPRSQNRRLRYTLNKGELVKFIKSLDDIVISKLKTGSNTYCAHGLCCNITTLREYESDYYRVGIFNTTQDVTVRATSAEDIREKTIHRFQFCGIIYCPDSSNCGTVSADVLETPEVRIEINEVGTTPFVVNQDLTYKEVDGKSEMDFESVDVDGFLFGFFREEIFHEKIPTPRDKLEPIWETRISGANGVSVNAFAVLILILITILNNNYYF